MFKHLDGGGNRRARKLSFRRLSRAARSFQGAQISQVLLSRNMSREMSTSGLWGCRGGSFPCTWEDGSVSCSEA